MAVHWKFFKPGQCKSERRRRARVTVTEVLCSANDLVFGDVFLLFCPPKFTLTRVRTNTVSFCMIFLVFFRFFSLYWVQHMPTGLAIKHHAHTNTRRKTIAAKRQSKTHSRTIRIHTLHNFISDKTNGFCMREFISLYILAKCACEWVCCVCLLVCTHANIKIAAVFSSFHFCLYYFCCHWCWLSLLPPPSTSSTSTSTSTTSSSRGLALYGWIGRPEIDNVEINSTEQEIIFTIWIERVAGRSEEIGRGKHIMCAIHVEHPYHHRELICAWHVAGQFV